MSTSAMVEWHLSHLWYNGIFAFCSAHFGSHCHRIVDFEGK